MQTKVIKPWYREPWAWLIVGPLFFVIFLGIGLVFISVKYRDDVVRDDYYKEGKAVNKLFEAEREAHEQGLAAILTLNLSESVINVTLNEPVDSDEELVLMLSHPLKANQDHEYLLHRKSLTGYEAEADALPKGRWYLRIESRRGEASELLWRLSGEADFSQQASAELR
ncbi:FixH family protein [Teredinibacter turnerae]|uniref:FixH family protein n=1 Tax=Teredinibacter turnerae TaxID=2426 RepID=UPI0005F87255|nr:FixH family protein [Teredinibacter turnerae]